MLEPVGELRRGMVDRGWLDLTNTTGRLTVGDTTIAFAGVAKFPARVKCALLGWMAWKDATAQVVSAAPAGDPA